MAYSLFKPKRKDKRSGQSVTGKYWWGQYRIDGDPKYTRISLKTTDKRVALQRLTEMVTREERLRAGILAPTRQLEAASTLLSTHLENFIQYQQGCNRSPGYTRKLEQRVTRLLKDCDWKLTRDVSAESFVGWRHNHAELSPKTLNDYQHAIFALLNWLKKDGRIELNPIESVGRVDGRGKQTFERRAFNDDEVCRLLNVCGSRRGVYIVALHTGLRLGELRSLRWADVDLHAGLIRLRAATTKSKRADVIPISPLVMAVFREMRTTNSGAEKVFANGVPSHHTFNRDLTQANIPKCDEREQRVDFHALRKTFITNLQRVGVPQRHTMALARHTDARLTANVYTDTKALPLAGAVESLPTYGIPAQGNAQDMDSGSPSVSQSDTESCAPHTHKPLMPKDLMGVGVCQTVPQKDTEQKWSRGESNPRPRAVSRMLLRA